MAIYNYNTIQTSNDLSYTTSYTNNYLIESLANLGQRFSIKGDSVKTSFFTFNSMFDTYVAPGTLGEMYYLPEIDKLRIRVRNSEDFRYVTIDKEINTNWNKIVTDEKIALSNFIVNNILYYEEKSIIYQDADYHVFLYKGVQDENYPENGKVYGLFKVDKETETIVEAIYFINNLLFNTDDNNNGILDRDEYEQREVYGYNIDSEDPNHDDSYKIFYFCQAENNKFNQLEKYGLDLSEITTNYLLATFDLSIYSNYNMGDETTGVVNFFDALKNFTSEEIYDNYLNCFGNIIYYLINTFNIKPQLTEVYYDETNKFNHINNINNDWVSILNNDIVTLFPYIRNYFSNKKFNPNNSIREFIITNLTKHIFKNSNVDIEALPVNSDGNKYYSILLPVDFNINYYTNDDTSIIYASASNIPINFVDKFNVKKSNINNQFTIENLNSTVSLGDFNKAIISQFAINYIVPDNLYDDYVLSLTENIFDKIFTLPYIDSNNYWRVNDSTTNILAKGLNAGNPNLIFAYTHADYLDLLTDTNYEDIKEAFEDNSNVWQSYAYIPSPNLKNINNDNSANFKIAVNLPDITLLSELCKSKLLDSTLINITPIQNFADYSENESLYKQIYGENGTVTTFWSYTSTDSQYKIVKNPLFKNNVINDQIALDMNTLGNISNLIDFYANQIDIPNPDQEYFSYLVFDPIKTSFKNQSEEDIDIRLYPNITVGKNKYYKKTNQINNSVVTKFKTDSYCYFDNTKREDDTICYTDKDIKYLTYSSYWTGFIYKNNGTNDINSFKTVSLVDKQREVFNFNVPTIDMSETLMDNVNFIDQIDLIKIGHDRQLYHSYIGTLYNKNSKAPSHLSYSYLIMGTSNINSTIGTDSLIDPESIDKFKEQENLSLEFSYIYTNGLVRTMKEVETHNKVSTYCQVITYSDVDNLKMNWQTSYITYNGIPTPIRSTNYKIVSGKQILTESDFNNIICYVTFKKNTIKPNNTSLFMCSQKYNQGVLVDTYTLASNILSCDLDEQKFVPVSDSQIYDASFDDIKRHYSNKLVRLSNIHHICDNNYISDSLSISYWQINDYTYFSINEAENNAIKWNYNYKINFI